MEKKRLPYYMKMVIDEEGKEKLVPYCVYCDVPMIKTRWVEKRQGLLYMCYGLMCPECGGRYEISYEPISDVQPEE